MGDGAKRGRWMFRVGMAINLLVGLALLGLGGYAWDRLAGPARVISSTELSRLTRDNALQVLAMDEGLLEAYRDMVHSYVKAMILAAALLLIGTAVLVIGILRNNRPTKCPKCGA